MVVETLQKEHRSMDTINAHKARIFEEYRFSDNESNEFSQENLKSKKRWSDDRLQVFRSLLPDFVAGSLCLAFLIYGGSLWKMKRQ